MRYQKLNKKVNAAAMIMFHVWGSHVGFLSVLVRNIWFSESGFWHGGKVGTLKRSLRLNVLKWNVIKVKILTLALKRWQLTTWSQEMHSVLTCHHRRIHTMDVTATAAHVRLSSLVEAFSNTPYDITSPQQPDEPACLCVSQGIFLYRSARVKKISGVSVSVNLLGQPEVTRGSYRVEPDDLLSMNILDTWSFYPFHFPSH